MPARTGAQSPLRSGRPACPTPASRRSPPATGAARPAGAASTRLARLADKLAARLARRLPAVPGRPPLPAAPARRAIAPAPRAALPAGGESAAPGLSIGPCARPAWPVARGRGRRAADSRAGCGRHRAPGPRRLPAPRPGRRIRVRCRAARPARSVPAPARAGRRLRHRRLPARRWPSARRRSAPAHATGGRGAGSARPTRHWPGPACRVRRSATAGARAPAPGCSGLRGRLAAWRRPGARLARRRSSGAHRCRHRHPAARARRRGASGFARRAGRECRPATRPTRATAPAWRWSR